MIDQAYAENAAGVDPLQRVARLRAQEEASCGLPRRNWDPDSPYGEDPDGQGVFWFFYECRRDRQGRTPHGLTFTFWA